MEIVVASGKGGTGKTTFSAFLIRSLSLDGIKVVGVDADVEAPDLDIALGGVEVKAVEEVWESEIAEIDQELCDGCMKCYEACPFGATEVEGGKPKILSFFCEGCGLCAKLCPRNAIRLRPTKTGEIIEAESKYGPLITGSLELGRRHSGKLVETLKERGRRLNPEVMVVDAAAGTGCPVISSIVGADYLILLVEPSKQSLVGALKLVEVARRFRVGAGFVINKWDMNPDGCSEVYEKFLSLGLTYLGKVPFDTAVPEAYSMMANVADYAPNSPAVEAMKSGYLKLKEVLEIG